MTVIVPCFNEADGLDQLSTALDRLIAAARPALRLDFIFVDDGSSDATAAGLEERFGQRGDCRIIRHDRNRGIAAAIMTGIAQAPSDVVGTIDCDCTYDPLRLLDMVPLLGEGVAAVTASPYHPLGKVVGVPSWRLWLSRNLSRLYRLVLRHKLWTYTSCFRLYRRSALGGLFLRHHGFLGIAEILCQLDQRGACIVECPMTLGARRYGQSKMRILRCVVGHLGLLANVAARRLVVVPLQTSEKRHAG